MPIPEQTTNSDVIRPPVNGELDAAAKARVRRAIKVSILLETTLIALITGSMLVFGYLAYDSHQRVEAAAMLQSIQLTRAISAEIGQNLESARRAVKETVEALAIPGIWTVDPVMRNAALFGSKDLVRSLSTLAIIGTYGQLRAYSLSLVPPDTLYEEQPNFITASIDPAPGIFVSGPMHDRTTDRNVLVLTQRTNDAAGHFTGVVTGSVYMSYCRCTKQQTPRDWKHWVGWPARLPITSTDISKSLPAHASSSGGASTTDRKWNVYVRRS